MRTLKTGESRYWAAITFGGRGEYQGIYLDPKKAARAVDKVNIHLQVQLYAYHRMCGPGSLVKMAFCSVSPDLVCAGWAFHLESSAPIQYDHKINLTKRCVQGRNLQRF